MWYIWEGQSGLNAHGRTKQGYQICYPASNLECSQTQWWKCSQWEVGTRPRKLAYAYFSDRHHILHVNSEWHQQLGSLDTEDLNHWWYIVIHSYPHKWSYISPSKDYIDLPDVMALQPLPMEGVLSPAIQTSSLAMCFDWASGLWEQVHAHVLEDILRTILWLNLSGMACPR